MMWVVYNTETTKLYGKFYTKIAAKDYVKYDMPTQAWLTRMAAKEKKVALAKVDLLKLDEWRMWATLKAK